MAVEFGDRRRNKEEQSLSSLTITAMLIGSTTGRRKNAAQRVDAVEKTLSHINEDDSVVHEHTRKSSTSSIAVFSCTVRRKVLIRPDYRQQTEKSRLGHCHS